MGYKHEGSCASRLLMTADASPITLSNPCTAEMASPQTHFPPVHKCDHARRVANPGVRTRFIVAMHLTDQCDRSFTSSLVSRHPHGDGQRWATLSNGKHPSLQTSHRELRTCPPDRIPGSSTLYQISLKAGDRRNGCPPPIIIKPQFTRCLALHHIPASLSCRANLSSAIGPWR